MLGASFVLLSSACARLGDISGPTPLGGVVNSLSMNTPDVTINVGSTAALQVTARDADGQDIRDRTVTWSTSDANVAEVSSSGVLTALSVGVAQISASIAGRSATAQITVIQRPVSSIEIGPLAPRILVGGFIQLVALPRDDTGAELPNRLVFWSSSDATIANVDAAGFITGVTAGAATITAVSETREAAIGVIVDAVPVVSVVVSPRVDTIVVGQSTQLDAVGRDSLTVPLADRSVTWASADSRVATVSASGLVLGIAPGSARVDAAIDGVIGFATVLVQPRPIGAVIISPGQSTLTVGETTVLTAQITDASGNLLTGRTITYTSENPAIAEVSPTGAIRAVSPGVTTVRAFSEGQVGEMRVTVLPTPVASVRITPVSSTLSVGESVSLMAVALDEAGNVLPQRTVIWSSGAPTVLSVNGIGRVVATAPGTGLVFASIDGRLASATVTVRSIGVGSVQITPNIATIVIGTSADFVAVVRNANNEAIDRPIAWSSSNTSVAVVSSTGRVRSLSLGVATITATAEGTSASAVITVVPIPVANVTVALPSNALTVGQTSQATATLRDAQNNVITGRPVTWSSSDASVATVSSTGLVTAVAGGSASVTASSGAASGSATVTVTQVAGSLDVQRQPSSSVSGLAFATQPVVRILDTQGNVVTTGAGASAVVTATRASGSATLSGTTTATAVNGVATFTNLGFSGLGVGAHTMRFTTSNPGLTVVSAAVSVSSGAAVSMAANSSVSQSARVATAVSEAPSVRVSDAGGNAVSGVNIIFTLIAGGGTLNPTSPVTVATGNNGVASLNSWTLGVLPVSNSVRAVSAGLAGSPVTFNATATVGSATQLAIARQPAGATSGVVLGTQPVVEIRDAVGNRVVGATNAVTATVATGNGELVGTRTVNAVDGVATFSDLRLNGSGAHTLRFSVTGLTAATSSSVTVAQVVASLAIRQQPSGARSGVALTAQPIIEVRDNAGLVVVSGSGASLPVSAELASGSGSLSGTTPVNAVNGVVTFTNLQLTGGGTRRIRFRSATPALNVVSENIVIAAGAATNIAATTALSQSATVSTVVGAAPGVRVTDNSGNNVSGVDVTFTVTSGGGVTVPASVATVATNAQGLAALTSWTLGAAPGANTVTAAVTGLAGNPVTFSATGTVGAATQIVIVTQPVGAVSGVALGTQPVVELRDAQNNLVTSASGTITAAVASGGGAVAGTVTATAVNGVATFTNLRINGVGAHTVRFSVSGLSAATSASLNVTQVAASLQIQTQPAGAVSGAPLATQPVVRILDNANLAISTGGASELPMLVTIESGSGVLTGTTLVNASGGVATFSNLTLTGSGPHTLRFATATPSLGVVSSNIAVGAGAPTRIAAVSTVNQSAAVSFPVVAPSVEVTDVVGNPVSGVNVVFAVTAGGGTTAPASGGTVVTNANGRATLQSWTLGAVPRVNTVTATVAGLTGSPVTFNATATVGAATQLVLVTQPAGAVSGVPFTAQPRLEMRDASNNLVSTSTATVTVSRQSGTGTVVGTLSVNAVAGVVTFGNLQINGGGNHVLLFAAGGLASAVSNEISVSQVASSLALVRQPGGAASGVAFTTQPVVHILDNAGVRVETGSGATLQLTASRETGTGALSGTTQLLAVNGVVTFTDLALAGSGTHTLRFATTLPALSVLSSSFAVGAGAAARVAAASDTVQSPVVGSGVMAPSVVVTDAVGSPVSGVSVTFAVTAGGGTTLPVSGSVVVTNAQGIASLTSWTLGASAGTNTVTATVAGLTGSPVTFNATATAQPSTQLAIVTQPGGAVSGVPFTTQPVIAVRNASNAVVTSSTAAVIVEIISGSGALLGTQTVNAANGVATFSDLQLNGVGDHQLRFSSGVLTSATSNTLVVTQVASALTIERQPAGAVSGVAFTTQPIVRVVDNAGLLIGTGAAASLSVTTTIESGTGTLGGTVSINAVNGRAVFTNVSLLGTGAHTLRFATTTPVLSVLSSSITLDAAPAATVSARTSVSQSAPVSSTVAEAPSVLVTDTNGNPVSGVDITFAVTAGGGSTSPASDTNVSTNALGIASLTSWTLGASAGANTVTATVAGLTGSPVTFNATATAQPATQLAIVTQPAGAVSGVVFTTQPVIAVRNASNAVVTSSTAAVIVEIISGSGALLGTQTVNAVNGVATFTDLQLNGVGDHQLRFSSGVLTSVTSNTLVVTQVANRLAIGRQPAGAVSDVAFITQPIVRVLDNAGLLIASGVASTLIVNATIETGTGTLGGTVSVVAVGGRAVFTNLSLTGSGAHTLRFAITTPVRSVVSNSVTLEIAPPTTVAARTSVSQAAPVSSAVAEAPSVLVTDTNGNPVSGADVTFAVTAGGGSTSPASGANVSTNTLGIASLTSWTLGASAGTNTVTATVAGLTGSPVTFNATATAQPATQLAIVTQPGGAVSGVPFTSQPVIAVRDASNAAVTSSTAAVIVEIISGSGALLGTQTVNAVNGVATFSDLQLNGVGDHQLRFSSGVLTSATSSTLVVTQVASALTIERQPAGAVSGVAFTTQPIVRILDNANLLIESGAAASLSVTATIESGPGTLGGTASINAVNGRAVFTNVSLSASGAYTLRFATVVRSLSVVSSSFAVGAGAAASVAAVTAINQSGLVGSQVVAPSVVVTDVVGNPVGGVDVTFAVTAGGGTTSPSSGSVVATNAQGIASLTSWTLGASPGTNTVTATVAGLTGSPVTFNATATVQPATQLAITTQPAGAVSGVAFTVQPVIAMRDANDAVVASSTAAVIVEIISGSGALLGTQTVNAANGVATFVNLQLNGVGDHQLRFTAAGLTGVTSNTFAVTQIANALTIERQPAGAVNGVAFSTQPIVRVVDNAGLVIASGAASTLSMTATVQTGTGALGGAASVSAVNGRAVFTNVSLTGSGAHTLLFSTTSPALSVVSSSFAVGAGAATSIAAASAQTQSGLVGSAVMAPSVLVTDAAATPVGGVSVTFAVTAGGGTTSPASGSVVVTGVNGRATLESWTLGTLAGTNTVTATASGLSGSTVTFTATATAQPATQLAIVTQPGGAVSGVPFTSQPVIAVRDANDALVSSSTAAVTAELSSGGGTLLGTQTVNAVNGVATFTNLQLNGPGTRRLRFTAAGLTAVESDNVMVRQDAKTLVIEQQPSGAVNGVAFTTQPIVRVLDDAGLLIESGDASSLTVTAFKESGTGTLGGATSEIAVDGRAVFSGLSLTGSGAYTLRFTTSSPTLSVVSTSFTVVAGAAVRMEAASATDQSAVVGNQVVAPRVRVSDESGNPVGGVAVTFTVTAGGGTISPASGSAVASDANGVATLTSWAVGGSPGANTVTATVAGLTGSQVTFNATATALPATQVGVTAQPTSAVSGVTFGSAVAVQVRDANGDVVTTSTTQVTATIASGTGSLAGTVQVAAVNGVATFSNLRLNGAGDHTVQFAAAGLTSTVSSVITVTQTAASLFIQAQPTSAISGTAFSPQPVIEIRDNAGLRITTGPDATRNVTVNKASGDADLEGSTTVAAAAGIATFTDLEFTDLGTGGHTLEFRIESLGLSVTSAVIAVSAGAAATLSGNSTLTQSATVSTTVTAPPSVRVRDASGNPVAGVKVVFAVTAGGGTISPASGDTVITNAAGVATTTSWTLGAADGENTVVATSPGLTGSPVTFTATGTAAENFGFALFAPNTRDTRNTLDRSFIRSER